MINLPRQTSMSARFGRRIGTQWQVVMLNAVSNLRDAVAKLQYDVEEMQLDAACERAEDLTGVLENTLRSLKQAGEQLTKSAP